NRGVQDLLVVCGSGPLLFRNQGNGRYAVKRDAFKFERFPQGTFTHAALADYDRDGRLDIYFCLYNYYLGLDQYHYPSPYYDAQNGPPNFLLHNEGNGTFVDRTEAAGLNAENDRYSFACAWGDCDGNGWPDLYVANDFGRSNLYRNNGDGTFRAVSSEAHVQDAGAGMSACWADLDNDGKLDIYVANMWSPAGMRVSGHKLFEANDPEDIRALYRRHARGNSLYRNRGDVKFENVAEKAKAEVGRWAWSSDAWDFDHDGCLDLYVTNGYITGSDTRDLSSFFWRHVVAKSPQTATPSPRYEQGWNAINELIRSDLSWNGRERNVFYLNSADGSFADISGIAALDFPDDSRSFALADLDGDGRLEVVLKNRNAPQIRVLRNNMSEIGSSICFHLRGTKSNRDAIGAAITIDSPKPQTKYVQAGSGFLSQHTKELLFGLGTTNGTIGARIRWPSGLIQSFEGLPVNNRIEIEEGEKRFAAKPFAATRWSDDRSANTSESLPETVETWLLEPLAAPDFSLVDLNGVNHQLRSFRSKYVVLCFWSTASPACTEQMRLLRQGRVQLSSGNVQLLTINVDESGGPEVVRKFIERERISFPVLLATPQIAGVYNITYRYLFDRRRDLVLPSLWLIDPDGMIIKIYQGGLQPDHLTRDIQMASRRDENRVARALPFPGTLHLDTFQRNAFTYGVALFQRGYLDQAAESFKQVIAVKPQEPEAYYNLGTLYLRKNDLQQARQYLEQTVKLRPNYPEAWNNLGMIAAESGQTNEAIQNFRQSLQLRPTYATALVNLGNLYRREGNLVEAEQLLTVALKAEPENPDVNYNLGMLYARQNDFAKAADFFQQAVSLRPDYPDALNNLGVLFVRQGRYAEAQERFETCIRIAPNLDQAYLNLARLYVVMKKNDKAREVLQALLRQQPENKMALQTLEMLH
ncbi:MAG TPA: tetratricopeptide repeat protein, partial [Terriglobales bacterium]|nr:tetratricopeptide repeat protein [Terriglobales bacterium]